MRVIEEIQSAIVVACVVVLSAISIAAILHYLIAPTLRRFLSLASVSAWRTFFFAVFIGSFVYYGATKGTISYPYTDFEKRYIVDDGSYVSNDFIHVSFHRIIAPSTADLHIDYRQWQSTNDEDWVSLVDTTFADFSVPQDISFINATNYNFAVYTTWTPGAAVQTNGVWHSYWGLDKKLHMHYIPLRTAVRVDGETIATPKSREVANEND